LGQNPGGKSFERKYLSNVEWEREPPPSAIMLAQKGLFGENLAAGEPVRAAGRCFRYAQNTHGGGKLAAGATSGQRRIKLPSWKEILRTSSALAEGATGRLVWQRKRKRSQEREPGEFRKTLSDTGINGRRKRIPGKKVYPTEKRGRQKKADFVRFPKGGRREAERFIFKKK